MTDKIHSFVVVLDKDLREDDAVATRQAILQIKHVISVEGNVVDIGAFMAVSRAKRELGDKLLAVIYSSIED